MLSLLFIRNTPVPIYNTMNIITIRLTLYIDSCARVQLKDILFCTYRSQRYRGPLLAVKYFSFTVRLLDYRYIVINSYFCPVYKFLGQKWSINRNRFNTILAYCKYCGIPAIQYKPQYPRSARHRCVSLSCIIISTYNVYLLLQVSNHYFSVWVNGNR